MFDVCNVCCRSAGCHYRQVGPVGWKVARWWIDCLFKLLTSCLIKDSFMSLLFKIMTQVCLSLIIIIIVIITTLSQKRPTLSFALTLTNIDGFSNSFTDIFCGKFAISRLPNIPPHLNCVATLPCEIQIFKNHYNQNNYTCKKLFSETMLMFSIILII